MFSACHHYTITNELLVISTFLKDWFPLSHRDSALASYCAGRLAIVPVSTLIHMIKWINYWSDGRMDVKRSSDRLFVHMTNVRMFGYSDNRLSAVRLMNIWSNVECWDVEVLIFWDVEYWGVKVLRCWGVEILKCWDVDVLRFWDVQMLKRWDV